MASLWSVMNDASSLFESIENEADIDEVPVELKAAIAGDVARFLLEHGVDVTLDYDPRRDGYPQNVAYEDGMNVKGAADITPHNPFDPSVKSRQDAGRGE